MKKEVKEILGYCAAGYIIYWFAQLFIELLTELNKYGI